MKTLYLLAIVKAAIAHFTLDYPYSLGFDDDKEPTAPCGGFEISFNGTANITNFPLSGGFISIDTHHPASNFTYNIALEGDIDNFKPILPKVVETGIGELCIRTDRLNESWEGKRGVLQVVGDGPDGVLYQVSSKLLPHKFALHNG